MKKNEKLAYLKAYHFSVFIETREKVYNELSEQQTMFCCCGKLATGIHESNCKKFNEKVNAETISRLGYLLQTKRKDIENK